MPSGDRDPTAKVSTFSKNHLEVLPPTPKPAVLDDLKTRR